MPSDKDKLFDKVQQLFQKSQTIHQLENLLNKNKIQTYHRNGKLCGVYYGKRKYRLRRSLGIDVNQLLLKDKTQEKAESLQNLRQQKSRNKGLERER